MADTNKIYEISEDITFHKKATVNKSPIQQNKFNNNSYLTSISAPLYEKFVRNYKKHG